MIFSIRLLMYFCFIFPLSKGVKNTHNHVGGDTTFVDTTFVNWNKATLRSLNRLKHTRENGEENPYYESKIEAFMATVDIDDEEKVNRNAARYKFIKETMKNGSGAKDFYVVESDIPGELLVVRNFVLYPAENNSVDVDTYYFRDDQWKIAAAPKRVHLGLGMKLRDNHTKQYEGFNHSDVIITRFKDSRVVESEFFLFGTLSNVSNIKALIEE